MQHVVVWLTHKGHVKLFAFVGIGGDANHDISEVKVNCTFLCEGNIGKEDDENRPQDGGKARHLKHDSWFEPQFVEFLNDLQQT